MIETHVITGDRILETLGQEDGGTMDFLGVARALVRHHHERYDGTGYPDGLMADAIPPAPRLLALADVYDALRRKRPHRHALSHEESLSIICEQSEGQFDP
jgi:putative two-component system response regulator